jgi:hypothetical protein
MRSLLVAALGSTLAFTGSAFAQQPSGSLSSSPSASPSTPKNPGATDQNGGMAQTQQQVRQDLQQAGFKNIQFVESAFLIQATNKDGNNVVMMISPHQIDATETLNLGPSGQQNASSTTGSVGRTAAVTAVAQPAPAVREDAAQLTSDKASLERQIKRLEADEANLKSDTASGRMSAESKDALKVYTDKHAVKGEKKDMIADKSGSLQMQEDKAALQRALKRLNSEEASLKTDTASGRMSAESKDAEKVYKDRQAGQGEKKDIAADKSKVQADQKK